ncbi:hypothetical protein JCM11491_002649 [Sporobolomyces phaffii]
MDSEGESERRLEDWYKVHHPPSGREVQPYARDSPYFLSYAASSLDWDSFLTSALQGAVAHSKANVRIDVNGNHTLTSIPRKVLDVGCGSSHWILNQALQPGWEETLFTGLDAEPTRIDDNILPPSLSGRIAQVQHDFLDRPLPFDDNSFDFVRIARLNFAVPESQWIELLEDCIRVLVPGSYIEVVELDLALTRDNEQVQQILDSVLDHQFINSRPLTVIPSNLTLAARDMRSTGRIATRLPSMPVATHPAPLGSTSALSADDTQLRKFAAGSDPTLIIPSSTAMAHVALHGYANWLSSSSWGIANAALEARDAVHRTTPSSHDDDSEQEQEQEPSRTREKELGDLMFTLENWADGLRERAGMAQVVTSRFGWEPAFDKKLQTQLENNLPVLAGRLETFGRERKKRDSLFGGQQDPEVEFRYQQAELARRECEHELRAVTRRLEGKQTTDGEDEGDLGSLDIEVFVARAP